MITCPPDRDMNPATAGPDSNRFALVLCLHLAGNTPGVWGQRPHRT